MELSSNDEGIKFLTVVILSYIPNLSHGVYLVSVPKQVKEGTQGRELDIIAFSISNDELD